MENYILNVKHEQASWGARKIRERLIRRFSGISYHGLTLEEWRQEAILRTFTHPDDLTALLLGKDGQVSGPQQQTRHVIHNDGTDTNTGTSGE